ncbi:flagellar protein FlaG [Roseibium hamelinense]|uniref:Flagellar protein FlaG n=1 Tax=Roseibium hamelinense TaxID=150831 RepID=A0A562TBJ9_9HYPH|nr:flagellar protein FlaG [Roseibium hamelinense]MTI45260.1 hypothetical protein [Roseibium hamelinense]TWI90376.1 flagellar protein FlaG [Roseibium hamelinense]
MDLGLARPPLPSYTAITPVTKAPERTEPAVKTELPSGEAVAPLDETQQNEQSASSKEREQTLLDQVAPRLERSNNYDPEIDSFVYTATDPDTGEVVRQIPSETLRRLRVYAETIAAQAGPAEAQRFQTTV